MSKTEGSGERSERRPKLPIPRVPSVGAVTGISRRQQYSASTRKALVMAAESLFALRGYAATSLDAIVADAKVTKGALYHHFSGKQGIFEAVLEDVEDQAARQIQKAIKGVVDPSEKALAGLREFLRIVQQPTYSRVVVQEGPAVLGRERHREQEDRSTFGIVQGLVRDLLGDEELALDDDMLQTIARIFFGALSAAGETVVGSADPAAASIRVESAMGLFLAGIRALGEKKPDVSGS
ncbi:TetR/AcrR family transcriptional regulator [Nocardioides cavernaquae]|uniref:TetR/AcrR family transcriptional regulator n=1 Tax=Nocardioides cavernaquae TaxID=2321396 RepID=A0A3A5H3B8_9ACTN|nr:TetR/AcrR family transcriptional regulator [Nocardioides cavernaquae]RJS45152.1 TetR/AcrR family transcriptional regulator [Nocardioides cavernaquae]